MKSLIKISSIALVLFMANSVFAINGNPEFTIKNSGDKTFYFETKSMTSKDFEIRIQDDSQLVQYKSLTRKNLHNALKLQIEHDGSHFAWGETGTV